MTAERKIPLLLIHPLGYSAKCASSDISRVANIMPPLGLASIAAYLQADGIDSHIIDCYAEPDSDQLILQWVREHRPDFVGFSCTTSSFFDGVRIVELIKREHPQVKAVFGGVHVSSLKEQVIEEYPVVDYCVVGEGEQTMKELLTTDASQLGQVEGLVFQEGGKVIFTGQRKQLLDLDTLPFPAYEKLNGYPHAYKLPIFNYPSVPNASCISSRGCPYACSYCDRSVFRRTFRHNSAEYLYRHVSYLNEKFGIRHINFYDDQFTFQRRRVAEFCRKMIDSPFKITFNCAARAEHLDDELLQLMKGAGCWMISLGIETGDEELLAHHRQNPDLKMMRRTIEMIKKNGIRVKGLLMIGLPHETEQSIQRSKEYMLSLPLDDVNLAKFTPFPGSPIYKEIKEKGELLGQFNEDWEKMDCMQFQFFPAAIRPERLEELFADFCRAYYKRNKVMWGYFSMLWKSPDSWKRFLASLPLFVRYVFTARRMNEE